MFAVSVFDFEQIKNKISVLESDLLKPEVYSNVTLSANYNKQLKNLQFKLETFKSLTDEVEFLKFAMQDVNEDDVNTINSVNNMLNELNTKVESLYLQTLLNGKFDENNVIVKIHSGAGGTEACDWVQMLFRMYSMWAKANNFKLELIDSLDGDGAGLKSVTFNIDGINAYGFLKGEAGVHRLVRISPFDANKRRHTSFASVEIMPEIEDDNSVEIKPDEIKVDTFRSSGAGGQHVNKTESAIRITHLPTGIVVSCQNERSQIQNRETAMKLLKSKLVAIKEEQNRLEALKLKGDSKKIEWGSQIRSYVFCPYTMVNDHRTGLKLTNVEAVMDGDIQPLIIEYLKWEKN